MRRHFATPAAAVQWLALPVLVVLAAALAIALHRTGHTQGDDFALYLRQARSIFDGDIGAVVADNRFSVLNSDANFSPIAYPWVWPLVLSPFVHFWGLDFDRLKLVEVGVYCAWLVLLHGIARRRLGRFVALCIVAVFATAPAYLVHTDQLITEIPHLASIAIVIWWYDRIRTRGSLLAASRADLVVLGVLVTLAFNVRRESIVLLGVIAVMQLFDLMSNRPRSVGDLVDDVRDRWRPLATPYLAFAASAVAFQLVLPTALLPDNGNSSKFLDDRMSEYPAILATQLGLGNERWIGLVILALAAVGLVIGVRRRPTLDGPLALLGLLSALAISTHLRTVDRYWFQVTPWVVYFATVTCVEGARAIATALTRRSPAGTGATLGPASRRITTLVGVAPLLLVVACHVAVLPGDVTDARDDNALGRVQSGPSNPAVAPLFDAVNEFTPPDAIIAYYRARTMTLLTDRRAFQTKSLEQIAGNADYFAQRRDSTYWQPELSDADARAAGWEQVWSSPRWILWQIAAPDN